MLALMPTPMLSQVARTSWFDFKKKNCSVSSREVVQFVGGKSTATYVDGGCLGGLLFVRVRELKVEVEVERV